MSVPGNLRAKLLAQRSPHSLLVAYVSIGSDSYLLASYRDRRRDIASTTIIVFFQRERVVISIPLRKTYAICCFRTRYNNLLYPQFTRRFNNIIGAQHVPLEAFIIRHQHVPRIRSEMYNGIDGSDRYGVGVHWLGIVVDVEVRSKGIEDLAGICEVCFEGIDRGVGEGR